MNTLQTTIKRAFDSSFVFFSRYLLKAVPFPTDGMPIEPLGQFMSHKQIPLPNHSEPEPQRPTSDSDRLLSFEAGLNAIDADLYTPFMMHIEGYKNCEIAEYLGLTENQVTLTINKVRTFLQTHDYSIDN
ncbi:hypothetical protein DC487_10480 [Sphingobacterium corticibacter]|uniref:Uncharacterized protein n=2 Tax=Sphingobacterium corticibacter TaxID=2171749 RepID=A0A2T8HIQ8_9SPHI|nr:hypothetical protein DC487_10480 [Sphingobacterium corticibacter]